MAGRIRDCGKNAIQYILNTAGYNYPKTASGRAGSSLLLGKGLVWAEGSQHARQRKIMTPAFSFNTLRDFIPMFRYKSQKTVNKIKEQIESAETSDPNVVNMVPWLSRTTLDIIGAAAADYDFQAIEGGQSNKLTQAYSNLLADAFYKRSDIDIAVGYLMGKVPEFVFNLMKQLPTRSLKRMKRYMSVVMAVAQEVVDKQTALYAHGKEGSKDLMSVLGTIFDITFFFAGHETTSSSLVWALYELSRHPEYQTKVREEIKATRARVAERGDGEITISDLDSMQYLPALMKWLEPENFRQETIRFHPIVGGVIREAGRDDHIPLDIPIKLTTGEVVTSIEVEQGQQILLSFINYNRLKSVWGEDADVWRPERFLEDHDHKQQTRLGVLSNIATFSSGIRSCIGVLEMQAILVELVENFEFLPPPGDIEILRVSVGVMGPMVKGSKSGRTELPLTVKPL
ncbi:hypothetical protein Clacol_005951 [Clathrus columnatus]|uniref:Cytochrome P450 n=1 Tax=Clathrus columnatus TaxID=1419009 RepID=A0AAV5AAS7_9AGAM|nr:hypothetical protein Clacol_005951 [Clathrus columnatus]